MAIKHLILDYDGVLSQCSYEKALDLLEPKSGISREEVKMGIGPIERRYVNHMDVQGKFIPELAKTFNYDGDLQLLADAFNDRGIADLYGNLNILKKNGLELSILSNQLAVRLPHVYEEIRTHASNIEGVPGFYNLFFSPEQGFSKPHAGVSKHDTGAAMDVLGEKNLFTVAVDFFTKHNVSLDSCLFLDDVISNLVGSRKAGIAAEIVKYTPENPSTWHQTLAILDGYGVPIDR